MPKSRQTYHSLTYNAFLAIDATDYHSMIRYFEEHEQEILRLDFDEYYTMLVQYSMALFETGAYSNYTKVAPVIIEATIQYNIRVHRGRAIFEEILFRKAAAHYHLLEYKKAEHILRELIKMDSPNNLYSRFLKKCLYRKKPKFVKDTRAISVFIFLLSSLVIAFEILFVRNFLKTHTAQVELLRNVLFVSGWLILIGGEVIHYWRVGRKVQFFKKRLRKRKRKPQAPEQILEEV